MKRLGNVYDSIISLDNLHLAFRKAAKGRRKYAIVQRVESKLDKNLIKLHNKLASCSYTTSTYKSRIIHEPKRRIIHSLPFYPDRIVHHALLNILGPYWDSFFIHDSYACREGKGQHAGSRRCMGMVRKYSYVLKCDISKFYHSIPHDCLKRVVRRKLKCEKTLDLLDEIIDGAVSCPEFKARRGIPIGNLVSQWLGNLYLHGLDIFVKHSLLCRNYLRYCDDFVLFSDSKRELRGWGSRIEEFLSGELNLLLSKCELFPTIHGVDYLGYRHFRKYVLLRKSTAKRIRRRIAQVRKRLGVVGVERLAGQVASAAGWVQYANTYNFCSSISLEPLRGLLDGQRYVEAV